MIPSPIEYDMPLYRPPSEAYSLILQVTLGCTWNKCAFCEMYKSKRFTLRKQEDVIDEIRRAAALPVEFRKVFLADGNPMSLSTERLMPLLEGISTRLPKVRRISTYALPGDISRKSMRELKELREAGLTLLYVGIESGDDEVLRMMAKGETYASTVSGLRMAREAGIKLSVMILNGVGGKLYSGQHAVNSARILNEIQPEFASVLVLSFPFGEAHYKERFAGRYVGMNIVDLLEELRVFIDNTDLQNTVFRSDHASNYLVLKGRLGQDKADFLQRIDRAISNPELAELRQEWQRGL